MQILLEAFSILLFQLEITNEPSISMLNSKTAFSLNILKNCMSKYEIECLYVLRGCVLQSPNLVVCLRVGNLTMKKMKRQMLRSDLPGGDGRVFVLFKYKRMELDECLPMLNFDLVKLRCPVIQMLLPESDEHESDEIFFRVPAIFSRE